VIGERWIGKDLEGSDHDVIEVVTQHLLEKTDESHIKPQSE
jgi:hypothetical protein